MSNFRESNAQPLTEREKEIAEARNPVLTELPQNLVGATASMAVARGFSAALMTQKIYSTILTVVER